MTPAYEAFVTVRVVDSGNTMKISVLDKDGAYVEVFYLTNIGASGFTYENRITGEIGTGKMKESSIANPGYMSFFHHGGNRVHWGSMCYVAGDEDVEPEIAVAALLDKESGKEISGNVFIDNTNHTITFTVPETQDIKSIEPVFLTPMKDVVIKVGDKLLETDPYVALSDTEATDMLVIGGGMTKAYQIYVSRGVVPEFKFDGVATQSFMVDQKTGVITANVGYDTDLSRMRLLTLSDGIAEESRTPYAPTC